MTQEDPPSAENAREVEEDEEAAEDVEDVAEPKVAPTVRTTVPPSSRETVRTRKATHLTVVTTSKQISTCQRLRGLLNTWEQISPPYLYSAPTYSAILLIFDTYFSACL